MNLSEQIAEDLKEAMKTKDKVRLSVVRMVRAAVKNKEIDDGKPLSDDEVLGVIQKELKQRRDSLEAFEAANREDLITQVKAEMEVLVAYLPSQLTEDDLRDIVNDIIQSVGAKGKSDVGKVMGALMPRIRGRADGKVAQQVVQSMLGNS